MLTRFRDCLASGQCGFEGHVGRKELSIALAGDARHVFSPWVSLSVYPHDGGARLRGVFGPHPHLWTMFVFIYASWSVIFVAGLIYGYAQWVTKADPAEMWVSLSVALAAAVFQGASCAVDLVGRGRSRPQMDAMRAFLHQQLPNAAELPPDAPPPWA